MWPSVPASFTWLTRVVTCVGTSSLLLNGVSWRGCGWGVGNAAQIRHRTSKLTQFEQEPGESNRSFWKLIRQLDQRKRSLDAEMSMRLCCISWQEVMRVRSGSRKRCRSEQDIEEDPSAGPASKGPRKEMRHFGPGAKQCVVTAENGREKVPGSLDLLG